MTTFRNRVDLLPEMVDRIVRQFDPVRIILFGSQARGDARPDSDVDLLIIVDDGAPLRDVTGAVLSALSDMPVFKDIVVTSPSEIAERGELLGTVLRPALREGKTLYARA